MFANKRRYQAFQTSNRRPPVREARILTTGGVNKLFKEWTMCIHSVVLRKKTSHCNSRAHFLRLKKQSRIENV